MINLDDMTPDIDRKRIRFISDLHLGHPGGLLKTSPEFEFLTEDCDILVVCGDYAEFRKCAYRSEAEKLAAVFESVCHQAGVELVVLTGNHDPDQPEAFASLHCGAILAMHGHELFKEVAPWGREFLYNKELARETMDKYPHADDDLDECLARARAMSLFVPPVLRRRESSKKRLFDLTKNVFWPPMRSVNILLAWLTMRSRVKKFAANFFPEAKVVCYGHLHRRDIYRSKGRLYINTGALFKHAKAYAVDISGEHIVVRRISQKGWGTVAARYRIVDYC